MLEGILGPGRYAVSTHNLARRRVVLKGMKWILTRVADVARRAGAGNGERSNIDEKEVGSSSQSKYMADFE